MKSSRGSKMTAAGAIAGAMAIALAACGSGSPGAAGSTGSTASTGSTGTSTTQAGATSTLVKEARAAIKSHSGIPKFVPPGPSIDTAKLQGKTVMVVSFDQADPALAAISKAIQQAGSVANVHVEVLDGHTTPTAVDQDLKQAANQHVAALILDGVATNFIPTGLAALQAANIPVIGAIDGQPSNKVKGQGGGTMLFGEASGTYAEDGRLMADTAIVDAGKAPIRAVEETFDNPVATAAMSGLNSVLKACNQCKVTTVQTITPGQWSTKVAPTTATAINATPNVNFVFPIVDSMGIYATSGVNSANKSSSVKVVSGDGSGSGPLSLVKSGGPFVADPGFSDTWVGWLALDQAMRAMSGMKPGNPVVPVRYLTKSNLQNISNLNGQATLFGDSFVKGFEQLWGVKK